MNANFWRQKWQTNNIAFHKSEAHPLLVKHFSQLDRSPGSRVFLPLCGKTLDIGWLLHCGYRVAGAELVELAIEQLFAELAIAPQITPVGNLKRYSADRIDIFVGNIFELSAAILGPVDAVYDRAALVALPEPVRQRYTAHLQTITATAPQFLITFQYDQTLMTGPPFSISAKEVQQHYGDRYRLSLVDSQDVAGGLKGNAAEENVWLLRNQP
ncbi:MAG: thiopurine S-methyltransferase [Cyanobacteria bacterium P01_C01_bin.120]